MFTISYGQSFVCLLVGVWYAFVVRGKDEKLDEVPNHISYK